MNLLDIEKAKLRMLADDPVTMQALDKLFDGMVDYNAFLEKSAISTTDDEIIGQIMRGLNTGIALNKEFLRKVATFATPPAERKPEIHLER